MKNEVIEVIKAVMTGVFTKIVIDFVKKIIKGKQNVAEIEIEYKTTLRIKKYTA